MAHSYRGDHSAAISVIASPMLKDKTKSDAEPNLVDLKAQSQHCDRSRAPDLLGMG
jgi:hypothetical protein